MNPTKDAEEVCPAICDWALHDPELDRFRLTPAEHFKYMPEGMPYTGQRPQASGRSQTNRSLAVLYMVWAELETYFFGPYSCMKNRSTLL